MELIKIYNGSLVNARELHQFLVLEAKKGKKGEKFSDWIKRMLEFNFKIGDDFFTVGYDYKGDVVEENGVPKFRKSDNQRVSKREYYLTLNCAKQLAMIQNNEKGREARQYFIQCEETILKLKEDKRFEAFLKLESTKEKLRQNILNVGGDDNDFIQIDTAGRKIFFNGKLIPDEELPRILILSRDLASEMTNEILKKETYDVSGIKQLNETHHGEVRNMLKKNIGTNPEELPKEERIKKLGK